MDYELSDHAKAEMETSEITKNEVIACLEHGSDEIIQVVNGETRYGKKILLKDKTLMVIYTYKGHIIRIITTYIVWRKKWQKR